jgi:hypothetical protein
MIELEAGGRRVHVPVGAHACHLSTTTADAEQTARAFLRDGLRAGERCVTLVPGATASVLVSNLVADGIDPEEAFSLRRLVFHTVDRSPVSSKSFDPYGLVARHLTDVRAFVSSGGIRLRILVDMHWYVGETSPEAILRYEAACHATMRAYAGRVVVLAQYRYADLPGDTVIDLLRLHPSTVVAQYVRRNPHPADPVTFMTRLLSRASA